MFVITADQVNSRKSADAITSAIGLLTRELGDRLTLPPDRIAGDEVQVLVDSAGTALDAILLLSRTGQFTVGCGIGTIREPLATSIRESTGAAFIAARSAVERAKRKSTRFALDVVETDDAATAARDVEAIIDLLLILRARRSPQGWELHDLVANGLTQAAAAGRLGITAQAASNRARAADLKPEFAVTGAVVRLLENLHTRVTGAKES